MGLLRSRYGFWLIAALVALVLILGATHNGHKSQKKSPSKPATTQPTPNPALGKRTKSTGCVIHGKLPDPACTPGRTDPKVTDQNVQQTICVPGYAARVRPVPARLKNMAYREYGLSSGRRGAYTVDHLVSVELGGSNDLANLWPEAATPKPGYHQKNGVENQLHAAVCSGQMALQAAQALLASDWRRAYTGH
jgi:hypothetical protein